MNQAQRNNQNLINAIREMLGKDPLYGHDEEPNYVGWMREGLWAAGGSGNKHIPTRDSNKRVPNKNLSLSNIEYPKLKTNTRVNQFQDRSKQLAQNKTTL